ncbi:MAG TPA: dihydroneopterin aldolase [bacterium]|nr:dihydroneopterin aldolase [bacterium]
MIIRIKNLRLRAVIGINDWERKTCQDVIINIEFEFDGTRAAESDDLKDTVDYKNLKMQIMKEVESSRFFLIDKLAHHVLTLIMRDQKVQWARVEVDKPHALRFADSVSVSCEARRDGFTPQYS